MSDTIHRRPLVLASQSPRRLELLQLITSDFTVVVRPIDERGVLDSIGGDDLANTIASRVTDLAEKKARAVCENVDEGAVIIGADTIVVVDGKVLGKPASVDEATAMLRSLCGKTHSVITGIALLCEEKVERFAETTTVTFFPLDKDVEQDIADYVKSGAPMDKAGAYGIQDRGCLFVDHIEGDYFNVVGLPVARLNRELKAFIAKCTTKRRKR